MNDRVFLGELYHRFRRIRTDARADDCLDSGFAGTFQDLRQIREKLFVVKMGVRVDHGSVTGRKNSQFAAKV